uniref:Cytosol aminopeptidase domain-containing protein n=2 Tax=Rhodosorus marinus TaxID=101924 RepID=A0A7S3ACU5_9RHOD|mmetsp:Transcript_9555/g.41228  ORF Transcript_9555/g.41228 Transcript_9555/m.41228 type:complete len:519 (+) Transcript_9555:156-1712(+)|eukprot:CAMPEP_0113958116 /NCGR_PEP_ID=MMETSP0011_2-20120614/3172_1 /TAXON_ID=101924 /ORGANISM="Rhodosorus marinus" /LENGTH=518 /DNA_ID=CAMNT_0000968805 /DNA_START=36 /DNA_END=1592 /DNA_ORIENTATION=+ /assembly_acc=CAM_ASM_000156
MDTAFVSPLRLLRTTAGATASRTCTVVAKAVESCGEDCVENMSRFANLFEKDRSDAIPIRALSSNEYDEWVRSQRAGMDAWLRANRFSSKKAGSVAIVPIMGGSEGVDDGKIISEVILSTGSAKSEPWTYADLPKKLPPNTCYEVTGDFDEDALSLGWALGGYEFNKYKSQKKSSKNNTKPPTLKSWPKDRTAAAIRSTYLARDLINHPAEDMTPLQLENAIRALGDRYAARTESIIGDALLEKTFPMIHAVGRAARSAGCEPRLIDLRYNSERTELPLVTIVGKGVCYDTGGLDIKPPAGMRNMKKDMGGAATAMGLAGMIMETDPPLRVRLLIPAVENSISGEAYRPGDILQSRKGITTEIENTDAEGRLILADAIHYACEEKPDLLIDFATLTGAQRVALGVEIPGVFCSNEEDGRVLQDQSKGENDLVWQLPLHAPYRKMLDSSIADMKNCSTGGFAGAITAALYLKEFVSKPTRWIHIDHMGFNPSSKPGRPEGGEAQGMRALFKFIMHTFNV